MKRFLAIALMLVLALGAALPSWAQEEAPEGVFLGTWPYIAVPEHNLNAYNPNGPNLNLGALFRSYIELPPAIYNWGDQTYAGLLAESWSFAEDGSYYEIVLKSDAMWSNGDAVTSEDVIVTYALGRIAGWSQFSYISDVIAMDDQTVHFVFSGEPSLPAERLLLKENIVARAVYGELAARALELFESAAAEDSEEYTAFSTELTEFRPEEIVASGPYNYTLDDVGDAFMTLTWQPGSIYSGTVN